MHEDMHLLVLGGTVMKGHCPESRHEVNHKASTQVEAAFIKKITISSVRRTALGHSNL